MRELIKYFSHRHILANAIFIGVLLLAIFIWKTIGKEEMPEFASNWIRINTIYPGAPAEDVELFVSKPIEDELKGVVGIEEVISTSSVGVSSIRVIVDDDYPDKDEVAREIKDAVLRTSLPAEVRDIPNIRQFKSSEKAILDIGFYHKKVKFLDAKTRAELQQYVLGFENQLLALKEISSIDRTHYLKPELQILVTPKDNQRLEMSLSEIHDQIKQNHIRVPIGSMQDRGESKVTALNELEDVNSLSSLIIEGNYEGYGVKLGELAKVQDGFARTSSILKINGHEGVFLNIKKSLSTDILTAQHAVMDFIEKFKMGNKDAPVGIVLMDDESYAVTNRLNIVSSNGLVGFFLIVVILFLFLNAKAGFWVAMGIPFSMAFTLIVSHLIGFTVNNMTLAGIIIVLGIVVDDAIIIAENISRYHEEGMPLTQAAITGTYEVFKPITASVITTCVAFIPLFFFEGFFGKLVGYIPAIIIFMLVASLLESHFILPSHLSAKNRLLDKFSKNENQKSWFHKYEALYKETLLKLFKHRPLILSLFMIMLLGAFYLFQTKMKYVMFPREESQEVFIKVKAPKSTVREETAKLIAPLEEIFVKDTENIVGVRSSVALSRRGGAVRENEANILAELVPADDRKTPLKQLIKKWNAEAKLVPGLESVKIIKGRWGHSSGSSIELQVQENDDQKRDEIVAILEQKMKQMKDLIDVEVDEPLRKKEYLFKLKQDRLIRYDVSPSVVTTTLRTFVEGSILYSINKGEEEIDVRLSVPDEYKNDLKELLDLRVENQQGQLIYLKNIMDIEEVKRPINISRVNYKRTTMLYANLSQNAKTTPLEIAQTLETKVFPEIYNQYPTVILKFRGEIEDSRESRGEFKNSVIFVIIMIYMILVVMFDSISRPFIILSIVPFGLAGVVYVLNIHGMSVYGFFSVIGALGMIGVVINDAIVMIDKIESRQAKTDEHYLESIAQVASTRLRPVLLTTLTTVVGVLPTAYGFLGYDSMLAEMMLTMGWGLAFGTIITLMLIPIIYSFANPRS